MAKQGSIKHYRQTGSAKMPASLPYGEIAIAKDGTIFAGNEQNSPVQAAPAISLHCTGQAGDIVTATLGDKQVTVTLDADGTGALLLPCTGLWYVQFENGILQPLEAYYYGDYYLMDKPYLYKPGDVCESITGGWQARALPYAAPGSQYHSYGYKPSLTLTADFMRFAFGANAQYSGAIETVRDIDLTRYSRICLRCDKTTTTDATFMMGVFNRASSYFSQYLATYAQITGVSNVKFAMDVHALSGAYDIGIIARSHNGTSTMTIYEIWLEG